MDGKEWLDTLPEDERLKVIAEHNKTIAQLKQPIDRVQDDAPDRWSRLQATADRRLELLIEIYETDGVGLTSYILVKIEEELGDDYFDRHTT